MASQTLLNQCDRDIWAQIKRWLHMEPFMTDGLLYIRCKDGGLGLIELVAYIHHSRGQKETKYPMAGWEIWTDRGSSSLS